MKHARQAANRKPFCAPRRAAIGALTVVLAASSVAFAASDVPPTWTTATGASRAITFSWSSHLTMSSALLELYQLDPAQDESTALALPNTDPCVKDDAPPGTLKSKKRWCAIFAKTMAAPDVAVTLKKIPTPSSAGGVETMPPTCPPKVKVTCDSFGMLPDTITFRGLPAEWRIDSKRIADLDVLESNLEWLAKVTAHSPPPHPASDEKPPALENPELVHDDIGIKIFFPPRAMPQTDDIDQYQGRLGQGVWAFRMAHLVARLNLETAIQYARQLPATLRMWNGPMYGGDVDRLALLLAKTPLEKLRWELDEDPFDALWVRLKVVPAATTGLELAIEFARVHRDWRMTANVAMLLAEFDNPAFEEWHESIEAFAGLPERNDYDEVFRKPTLMEWMSRSVNVAASAAFIAGSAVGVPGAFGEAATTVGKTAALAFIIGSSLGGLSNLADPSEGLPPDPEFESNLEKAGYWTARVLQLLNPFRKLTRRLYNYGMVPLHKDLGSDWTALFQDNLANLLDRKLNPKGEFQLPRFERKKGTWLLLTRWSLPFLRWERWMPPAEYSAAKKAFEAQRGLLRASWAPSTRGKKVAQVLLPTGFLRKFWKKALVERSTYQETIEADIQTFFETNKDYFFPSNLGGDKKPITTGPRKQGLSISTFGVPAPATVSGPLTWQSEPPAEDPLW